VLAVAGRVLAQTEGPLVGLPATILVGPGTESSAGPMSSFDFHRKTAGFVGYNASATVDASADPLFTTSAMFNNGLGPPDFHVDAISCGLEVLEVMPPEGGVSEVAIAPGDWSVLVYSVTRATAGEPGSLLESETLAPGGAGADLFSLTLPGSDIPPDVVSCYPIDVPQRTLGATEMDLAGPAGVTSSELASLDYQMTLYQAGPPIRASLPDDPIVFFSVDTESVFPPGGGPSKVPAAWFDCGLPSPASILKTQWDPVMGKWKPPKVHLAYDQLGLDQHDDIDALAVDRDSCLLLFSIRATATSTLAEQLQVATWDCLAGNPACTGRVPTGILVEPATDADGPTPVASRTGAKESSAGTPSGDIDGVCVIDPGTQGAMALAVGTPTGKGPAVRAMSAAIFRDDDDVAGGPTLTMTVSGLQPATAYDRFELWLPVGPSLINILSLPTSFLGTKDVFKVSGSHPSLAADTVFTLSSFWLLRQTGGSHSKESSPIITIDL
jgi:hypothetical protein